MVYDDFRYLQIVTIIVRQDIPGYTQDTIIVAGPFFVDGFNRHFAPGHEATLGRRSSRAQRATETPLSKKMVDVNGPWRYKGIRKRGDEHGIHNINGKSMRMYVNVIKCIDNIIDQIDGWMDGWMDGCR